MDLKPGKRQIRWGITIFVTGVALMLAFVLFFRRNSVSAWIVNLFSMLKSIIAGLVIAYVLSPMLSFFENRLFIPLYRKRGIDVSYGGSLKHRKRMRGMSVTLTIICFLLILYGLIMILVPQLIKSITEIVNSMPSYFARISEFANTTLADNPTLRATVDSMLDTSAETYTGFLKNTLMPNLTTVMDVVRRSVSQVIGFFITFLVGTIVAVYLLNSRELFVGQLKKMAYAFLKETTANEIISGFRFIHRTFTGFVFGKLIDSVIIGVLCFAGTSIMRIPYPVLISVSVGITNIIPFFGPYIGAIFGGILLVMIDPIKALIFVIFVIILQQFDGNILGPKILGNSTGLSSFWVIFSIMLFGGFWGPAGWILGVPIFACVYALAAYIARKNLKKKGLPEDSRNYTNAAYVENGELLQFSQVDRESEKYNLKPQISAWRRIFKAGREKTKK